MQTDAQALRIGQFDPSRHDRLYDGFVRFRETAARASVVRRIPVNNINYQASMAVMTGYVVVKKWGGPLIRDLLNRLSIQNCFELQSSSLYGHGYVVRFGNTFGSVGV